MMAIKIFTNGGGAGGLARGGWIFFFFILQYYFSNVITKTLYISTFIVVYVVYFTHS